MASVLGVITENQSVPGDDQSWLVNRITDGTQTVQVDLNTFLADESKINDYFISLSDTDVIGYVKSGIPLAIITSGDSKGDYGPYDPDATDGRNGPIEGLLESPFEVEFTRGGVKNRYVTVGMRYMGVINAANLPYEVDGATWHGLFLNDPMIATGSTGQSISLLAGAAGSGPAYTLPAATPTVLGGVKQAAFVADPANDASAKTEFIALRDALVASGAMAPKA